MNKATTKTQPLQKEEALKGTMEEIVEDPDNKEEADAAGKLFVDGPKLEKIEEWKSQFKNVFLTEFDDEDIFVWRALSRREYKELAKIDADEYYLQERVCEKCVLWPMGYGFNNMVGGKAGIPTYLYQQIMAQSGFVARTEALKL